jgi:hypothetical protein
MTGISRDSVDASPVLRPTPKIPTRKTDAWGTHQDVARTRIRLEQARQSHPARTNRAYIYFTAKVKPFGSGTYLYTCGSVALFATTFVTHGERVVFDLRGFEGTVCS